MRNLNNSDTIVAIATPPGESGIGIVRISGKDALKIADKIFVSKCGGRPCDFKTYTTHYGWVIDSRAPKEKNAIRNTQYAQPNIIDEVILTIMRAPRSYTKEDIVEINCHGGIVALRAVLELVLESGARLAEPGEFTRRAFLNGRIDLAQAEAVLDIIRAKTDAALKVGQEQLKGLLSVRINKIRDSLLGKLSILEASLDFPEDDIGEANLRRITGDLIRINNELKGILDASRRGRIMREGIHVVICGKPNAGKSSLLNALLKQERSIVTPIAGTTRDTIEEIIDIKGIPVRIVDTAGIVEPRDLIEKKAMQRSKRHIDSADLVILVFDGTKRLSSEDRFLIKRLRKKTVLAVINKIDLRQKIERQKVIGIFPRIVEVSAKRLKKIELLEEQIADFVYKGRAKSAESVTVSNLRHILSLKEAQKLIAGAVDSLDNKLSLEYICQDIQEALGYLDDVLGKRFSQELLDRIFGDFCIGK